MNIRSISELEKKILHVKKYAQIVNSYIELDIKNELGNFISKKLDFGKYAKSVATTLDVIQAQLFSYLENKLEELKINLSNIINNVDTIIQQQHLQMDDFMYKAHNQFVHKTIDWQYSTEAIHNNKNFLGHVHIKGEDNLMSSDTVIYETTRATYHYVDS